jgi:ABC-type branched-subunit amino acid transport system substrate-binding protein
MKGRRRALLALIGIAALVAASCGSDRGEDESGGADETPSETTEGSSAAAAGDFGDLQGVCGPNAGGGEVTNTDAAETQGVSADEIVIGTVSDPGFEGRPGLNQEIFDASEAFVQWCNEAGGINGKQIVLNLRDAAITEYQPVVEQSCAEDFALVGSGAVQDNFWPDVGAACGLIDVAGFSVTPDKAGTAGRDPVEARTIQPVPNPSDRYQTGSYVIIDENFPDAGAHSGVLYGDLETTQIQAERVEAGIAEIGHETVHTAAYNILGEANWAPFAQGLQDDGVEWMQFVGEGENFAQLLQAMDEIGYRPEVIAQDANFYDQGWLEAAGPSANGVFVRTAFWPIEEADANPATQQFLDLMAAQGGKVAQLGAQSMSAWLLFAQAARDCDLDDDLTRSCVLEGTAAVTDWTGGGLHAPTNPGDNEPPTCTIVLQVEDEAFTRYAPDEDYDCGDDHEQPFVVDIDI